ncbi:MAG TPA: NAD(P)-binding domain-containing protein [Anaerolineae bacterium]|nr:NAD(P)-binding domain-containing protein [Anaerolineae bacterium]
MTQNRELNVAIVGAGAAGVGIGVTLKELGLTDFVLLDRYEVGASFKRWPAEMRFITPSFTSNGFGPPDLNAVTYHTSPAHLLRREHPTGLEYAHYLKSVAEHFELPIHTGVDVTTVKRDPTGQGFKLQTSAGPLAARFVIWAAGEFQYPWLDPFPGAEFCLHNSAVSSWSQLEGESFVVIGGYESGLDAAYSLTKLGKQVLVLDRQPRWESRPTDPSRGLAPFTHSRLRAALNKGRLDLLGDVTIARVEPNGRGYLIIAEDGRRWHSPTRPILGLGFSGSLELVDDLFAWHEEGYPLLTEQDESTRTPGLFLVGPGVRHGQVIFCFIYKFRQRFAVVAQAIAEQLGLETEALEIYRRHYMFLDDLSCCDVECAC